MNRAFLAYRLVTAALLLLALADWPYAYFSVLRVLTTVAGVEMFWVARSQHRPSWTIPAAAIALLWNPVFVVHLPRGAWRTLDVLAAVLITLSVWRLRATAEASEAAITNEP